MPINLRIRRLLSKGSFARKAGTLTIGAALSQGLMVLSLPLLTRLYAPESFDLLAVYTAILSLLSGVACLRLNIAIPLPVRDSDAINLVALSLAVAIAIGTFTVVLVTTIPGMLVELLRQPAFRPYLWMIAPGIMLAAAYDALQYWASRMGRFGLVARTRITRAIGGSGTQLGFGQVNAGPFGLIFGHLIYSSLGVVGLAWSVFRNDLNRASLISYDSMKRNFYTYIRFPLYSVPETLLNTAGVQLPILMIAASSKGGDAGFLMVAMSAMGMPMALVGGAVAQAYLAEAPKRLRIGGLSKFTRRTMGSLLIVGGGPLIAIGTIAPFLFHIIFGPEWTRAGWIVTWLTPLFALQFIASPISVVLHVTGRLRSALALQAFGFTLRAGAVLLAVRLAPGHLIETFAISGTLFYAVYVGLILVIIRSEDVAQTPE